MANDLDDLIDEVLTSDTVASLDSEEPTAAEVAAPSTDQPTAAAPPPRVPAPGPKARRGMARQRERAGVCPMYAPGGTVCKTCGKVHPL